MVTLRGVISPFYSHKSVIWKKKKLGYGLVVVQKLISRWQDVILKIDYGLFRVLSLKYA